MVVVVVVAVVVVVVVVVAVAVVVMVVVCMCAGSKVCAVARAQAINSKGYHQGTEFYERIRQLSGPYPVAPLK